MASSSISETDIYNRALTKIGSELITSTSQNVERARVMDSLYTPIRDRLLRESQWNFSITRTTLSVDGTAPDWGFGSRFALPTDFISMISTNNNTRFQIEGNFIASDEENSLEIKYVARVTDTSRYDPYFVDALASLMAYEASEKLSQSNTKKSMLFNEYQDSVIRAKRQDGIEDDPVEWIEDDWILIRDQGGTGRFPV